MLQNSNIPICVDLDGTLIRLDTTWLATKKLLIKRPWMIFAVVRWLLRGRAYLKQCLAQRIVIDPATLPYHQPFNTWLKQQKHKGRYCVLVTAADQVFAHCIAKYLGLFDDVIASDGKINLRAHNKRDALDKRFNIRQYDYAGNSKDDLIVWAHVHKAIIVNPAFPQLINRCRAIADVDVLFN